MNYRHGFHEFFERVLHLYLFSFAVLLGQVVISVCLTTVPVSDSSSKNATYKETSDETSPIKNQTTVSETGLFPKMERTTADVPLENLTSSDSTTGNSH